MGDGAVFVIDSQERAAVIEIMLRRGLPVDTGVARLAVKKLASARQTIFNIPLSFSIFNQDRL